MRKRWSKAGILVEEAIAVVLQEVMRPNSMLAIRPAECSRARQGGGYVRLPRTSAVGLNTGSFLHLGFKQSNCFSDVLLVYNTRNVFVQRGWLTWSVLVV